MDSKRLSIKDGIRNLAGLLCMVGLDFIMGCSFFALMIMNYLACKTSFDYLGYDSLPLAKEAFIGQIIGPFFPDATLSHFSAFVVALIVAVGWFILCNRLFHIWELVKERKVYLSRSDRESAQVILYHIYGDILLIIFILSFFIGVILWDLDLFRYRSVIGALGIDDPAQAPLYVENWDNQIRTRGHLFAWAITSEGAFGYIGVTGVACVALEYCFRGTRERFMRLLDNVERIFLPAPQQEEQTLCGYDADRQPIYDPAVPVAYDISGNPVEFYGYDADGYPVYDSQTPLAYDAEGNPIQEATGAEAEPADGYGIAASSQGHHQQEEAEMQKETPGAARQTHRESSPDQGATDRNSAPRDDARNSDAGIAGTGSSGNSPSRLFNDEEVFKNIAGRHIGNSQLKDVIGNPEKHVSLAEAITDKERYWIDPDSLEIWDRNYRKTLFPNNC